MIRFFTPNMIPVSTAMWDPTWYKGDLRKDRNGVWIGLNDSRFHPPKNASCLTCDRDYTKCKFGEEYYNKIKDLDINEITETYDELAKKLEIPDPTIVLLVHESPSNPCSERYSLMKWFQEKGIELKEFSASQLSSLELRA